MKCLKKYVLLKYLEVERAEIVKAAWLVSDEMFDKVAFPRYLAYNNAIRRIRNL